MIAHDVASDQMTAYDNHMQSKEMERMRRRSGRGSMAS